VDYIINFKGAPLENEGGGGFEQGVHSGYFLKKYHNTKKNQAYHKKMHAWQNILPPPPLNSFTLPESMSLVTEPRFHDCNISV
jgi:hypothetical protein